MATYVPPKKNTPFILYLGLFSQANPTTFQANPTLAAGDVKVSIDGGAEANLTTLPTVTPAGGKRVKLSLSSSEMNGDNINVVFSDAAGAEWNDTMVNIQTSARQVDDLAFPATTGRSMVVDANGLVDANMVKAGPTGSGTAQTTGDIFARLGAPAGASLSVDIAAIKALLPSALVGGRMDVIVGAMAADVLTAAATAADHGTEIGTAVWAATTRILTANTNLNDLSAAATRTAIGLASANLDTQLAAIAGYIDTEVGTIITNIAALPTANANADALLDRTAGVETGLTLRQFARLVASVLLGKVNGAGTGTEVFRDVGDTKNRVTATVTAEGNRTAITRDAT